MKELVKVIAELVNTQLGIVNIDDGRNIYAINHIDIIDDALECNTIASQSYFILIDNIKSIKYIVTQ